MSMTLALGSAFNSMKANASQAAVLSRNVEYASSPYYVKQEASLVSRNAGGVSLGVTVKVTRQVDERLVRDVRQQAADSAAHSVRAQYLAAWAAKVGQPQDETSASARLNAFRTSLQALESNPGSEVYQLNAVRSAQDLARYIVSLDGEARELRADIDAQIGARVEQVNRDLARIAELNRQISGSSVADGSSIGMLMDERDMLVDRIAAEIGVTTYVRENGEMVILAQGGAALLDSTPNFLEHTPMGGLRTADGTDVTPAPDNASGIRSGAIAGLYGLRDETIPSYMSQLDGLAAGLVRMFEAADASLSPGEPGLFTDAGAAFDPSKTAGLAGRLAVNPAVVPSDGGSLWRISSGMSAAEPLPGADSSQAAAFLLAFDAKMEFPTDGSLPSSAKIGDWATAMVSHQQAERVSAENSARVSGTALSALQEARLNSHGVNIDDELMKMSLVEHSYQASSTVIKAVQDMMDALLAAA